MGALDVIHADLVGQINRAGVPILAGTDSPILTCIPVSVCTFKADACWTAVRSTGC